MGLKCLFYISEYTMGVYHTGYWSTIISGTNQIYLDTTVYLSCISLVYLDITVYLSCISLVYIDTTVYIM